MNQVFLDFVQLYAIIIIFTRESGGATGGDYHLKRRRSLDDSFETITSLLLEWNVPFVRTHIATPPSLNNWRIFTHPNNENRNPTRFYLNNSNSISTVRDDR